MGASGLIGRMKFLFQPLFFAVSLLVSTSAFAYEFPAIYCSVFRVPKDFPGPKYFAIYGKIPTPHRPHPSFFLKEGETIQVVADLWYVWGKRIRTEQQLRWAQSTARYVDAYFVGLPIELVLPFWSKGPGIYATQAYYADEKFPVTYECHQVDMGLPGGAMGGGS